MNWQDFLNSLQSMTWLIVQCVGVLLITILSLVVKRSMKRAFLDYWTAGWICLATALVSLAISVRIDSVERIFLALYYLGEYAFGFLLIGGCRNYASGNKLTRRHLYALFLGGLIAITLAFLNIHFNSKFIFHSAILAGLFIASLVALLPARGRSPRSLGIKVISVALALLALDFLHYVALMTYVELRVLDQFQYLRYTAVFDLILEILLGFGTVMLVLEDARHEVEATNRELVAARDRLEILARMDPLTEALNRHAFHSLLEKKQDINSIASGCVVIIDIDNLKPINDRYGHTAGDAAIREVVRSIRSVIRADDLLFRWGGDEFLILFFKMTEEEARKRVNRMNMALSSIQLPGFDEIVPLVVSFGIQSFGEMSQIELAFDTADSAMYINKHSRMC